VLLREEVENRLKGASKNQPGDTGGVDELLNRLNQLSGVSIWITSESGETLFGSPGIHTSDAPVMGKKRVGSMYVNRVHGRQNHLSISVPFQISEGREGFINIIFSRPDRALLVKPFVAGIAIIGAVISLMLRPVSRLISRPLEKLQHSVQRITQGDLSHRAEERSRDEIGNLVKAFNRMAGQVERMISGTRELSAHISHELRSPLTRIRVAQELLRNASSEGKLEGSGHLLDCIEGEIEEMDLLIGKILELSKLDMRHSHKSGQQLDMTKLLRDTVEKFSSSIEKKSLSMNTVIPERAAIVKGDQEDLRTCVSNLVDNAIKYTPSSGEVVIELHEKGAGFEINLTNSCRKNARIDDARLFEPFYRETQSGVSGSGLGLAIAKKIIESHAGRIHAHFKAGRFTITLWLPDGEVA